MSKEPENMIHEIVIACGGAAAIGRKLGATFRNPSAMASYWHVRSNHIPIKHRRKVLGFLRKRFESGEIDEIKESWEKYLTSKERLY